MTFRPPLLPAGPARRLLRARPTAPAGGRGIAAAAATGGGGGGGGARSPHRRLRRAAVRGCLRGRAGGVAVARPAVLTAGGGPAAAAAGDPPAAAAATGDPVSAASTTAFTPASYSEYSRPSGSCLRGTGIGIFPAAISLKSAILKYPLTKK